MMALIKKPLAAPAPSSDKPEATEQGRQMEEQRKLWRHQQAGPVLEALKQWLKGNCRWLLGARSAGGR
jgi:hypothetical protein